MAAFFASVKFPTSPPFLAHPAKPCTLGRDDDSRDGMPLAKTYTENVGVGIRAEQWEELKALLPDVGISTALRDASLRVIGRVDLIIDTQRDESGHRRRKHSPSRKQATVPVGLTREQKAAIVEAAQELSVTVSAFMHDALRFELGLEPVKVAAVGWKRGRRRSRKPPA